MFRQELGHGMVPWSCTLGLLTSHELSSPFYRWDKLRFGKGMSLAKFPQLESGKAGIGTVPPSSSPLRPFFSGKEGVL